MTSSADDRAAFGLLLLAAASTLLTWFGTGAIRQYAIRNKILDVPNKRSSHTAPIPRGGGIAIAATTLLIVALASLAGWLAPRLATALLGGGSLVAFIGWLDDRKHVNAALRATAHLGAAIWTVAWLGGFDYVRLGEFGVITGPIGNVLAVLAIAWMTNLYNFMDGIDGLAAAETIAVGAAGATILLLGNAWGLAVVSAALAGCAGGFLVWNRMPARIFMGDVGSGFLGFMFGAIALAAHKFAAIPATVWLLLLLVFIGDATVTLMRRILRGEPWHLAHRHHAYQRLVQSGSTHAQVVRWVALLNMLLAGLAVVVFLLPQFAAVFLLGGVTAVAVAYAAVEHRLGMWNVTLGPDEAVIAGTEHVK